METKAGKSLSYRAVCSTEWVPGQPCLSKETLFQPCPLKESEMRDTVSVAIWSPQNTCFLFKLPGCYLQSTLEQTTSYITWMADIGNFQDRSIKTMWVMCHWVIGSMPAGYQNEALSERLDTKGCCLLARSYSSTPWGGVSPAQPATLSPTLLIDR